MLPSGCRLQTRWLDFIMQIAGSLADSSQVVSQTQWEQQKRRSRTCARFTCFHWLKG
jgi:hypothetical protein